MKGDFTRDTFDKSKHFSRVLKQQGRVELDADFNEQTAILLHRQQTLAADLIGQHGTPPTVEGTEGKGFEITDVSATDFKIGKGHYYVDGILCENEGIEDENGDLVDVPYTKQPDYPYPPDFHLPTPPFLVYLDVWERHISHLEDALVRDVGLGVHGPDTATRAKVVWQVKVEPNQSACPDAETWERLVEDWQPKNRGLLKAATVRSKSTDLESHCIIPPEARYRGAENQLYRVEIHKKGAAGQATFKWSRDNGSVIFPVTNFAGEKITLGSLGHDQRSSLERGHWVELVDDDMALMDWRENEINPLGKVTDIDYEDLTITVEWPESAKFPEYEEEEYESKHVFVRRWDHREPFTSDPEAPRFDPSTGTLFVDESTADEEKWFALENGVQVHFAPAPEPASGQPRDEHDYRTGDYWLIPARTATRDVEWPGPVDDPEALPPHGVEHHYAPLSVVPVFDDNNKLLDCRRKITSVIGPDSDLQVRNLDVRGNLNVAADTIMNGDVGIGTTSPSAKVEIAGGDLSLWRTGTNNSSQALIFKPHDMGPSDLLRKIWVEQYNLKFQIYGGSAEKFQFQNDSGNVHLTINGNDGNVGIGADPENAEGWSKVLDIAGSSTTKLSLRTPNIDARVLAHDIGWWSAPAGMIIGTSTEHPVSISTHGVTRFTIGSNGVVSIPGDMRVDGVIRGRLDGIKIGYVIDQFVNTLGEPLEEGDVVIIGDNQTELYYGVNNDVPVPEVDLAQKEYDTRVCGIVSEVYGELTPRSASVDNPKPKAKGKKSKGDGKQASETEMRTFEAGELTNLDRSRVEPGQIGGMVTLGTYAYCKVDADIAAIQVGDLLTTSPTKGHAQKVVDRSQAMGAIIGKALGSLKKGKGKIPVLVMLQ